LVIDTEMVTRTVSFTEQLLPSEDLNHKIEILNKHVDALNENSMKFIQLFYNIIINGEQKGEIVEAMEGLMKELQTQHSMYNNALGKKIESSLINLIQLSKKTRLKKCRQSTM